MARWINIAGYQLVWLASVIGAARAHPWLGVTAAGVFVSLQGYASLNRRADVRALVLALVLGVAIDGGLSVSGLLRYAQPQPAAFAPLWILAIWAAFALTLNHSLAFLSGRPVLAVALGAVGAPLAYLAAARGFGVITFAEPAWKGFVALGSAWAIAMYLFGLFGKRFAQRANLEVLR